MQPTILVVDDEKNIRRTLGMVLQGEGYSVQGAASAEEALEILASEDVDLMVLDIRLPGMSGLEMLEQLRSGPVPRPTLPVLVISGHASLQEAVAGLRQEVAELRAREQGRAEMIGSSAPMKRLVGEIEKVAPTKGRVLITGESGSGKELVARAIHRTSPRAARRFVKLNCAAIPVELIESEMFGYERGAFTGAQSRKRGQFELANGGTLLLDEIGDMSLSAQAKVLRVLQSGELVRVGGEQTVEVDVRVLAATNKDLSALVRDGEFREDLYFRLNVVRLHLPPLRDRTDDVPLLVERFVREICAENGFRPKPVDSGVLGRLQSYKWPGNVRELKNVVERMVIMSGDRITVEDYPEELVGRSILPVPTDTSRRPSLRDFKEQAERAYILETLTRVGWNVSKAAGDLGVERTNLHKKIKALGIKRDDRAD